MGCTDTGATTGKKVTQFQTASGKGFTLDAQTDYYNRMMGAAHTGRGGLGFSETPRPVESGWNWSAVKPTPSTSSKRKHEDAATPEEDSAEHTHKKRKSDVPEPGKENKSVGDDGADDEAARAARKAARKEKRRLKKAAKAAQTAEATEPAPEPQPRVLSKEERRAARKERKRLKEAASERPAKKAKV